MKIKTTILIVIIGSFLNLFAVNNNFANVPKGFIVFAEAQGLYEMDLHSCKREKLYGNRLSVFTNVSKVNKNKFLFVQNGPPRIGVKMFNLKTKVVRLVYWEASTPYYNPYYHKLFFYYAPTHQDGTWLYVAPMNVPIKNKEKIVAADDSAGSYTIPISRDKIIFVKSDAKNNNPIYEYNIKTKQIVTLPIKNCTFPQIWRSKTKQLLCLDRDHQEYFLTDLAGKYEEPLHVRSSFAPLLYLPQYDSLLFRTTSFGFFPKINPEKGDLEIYNFKTGKVQKSCDNLDLGMGDVVYYSE